MLLGNIMWGKEWQEAIGYSKYGAAFYVNYLHTDPVRFPVADQLLVEPPVVEARTGACLRVIDRHTFDVRDAETKLWMLPDNLFCGEFGKDTCNPLLIPITVKVYCSLQLARTLTPAARDMAIRYRMVTGERPTVTVSGSTKPSGRRRYLRR